MRFASMAAAAAMILMATQALAQSGWSMIGQREVGPDADHDTINVPREEQHNQLMFCTEGHGIRLLDGTIHYRDGRAQAVRVRATLASDHCGRAIELSGRNKDVASMDFSFEVASLGGTRSKVQLYAR